MLRTLLRSLRAFQSRPAVREFPSRSFRPRLEVLEDRRVLSTLYVSKTSFCDGHATPYTTIQSAVDAASPGTTIEVCPGTYTDR
jgi:hypothetical protein